MSEWTTEFPSETSDASIAKDDGFMVVSDSSGNVRKLNLEDGSEEWQVSSAKFVAVSNDGSNLYTVTPTEVQVRNPDNGNVTNTRSIDVSGFSPTSLIAINEGPYDTLTVSASLILVGIRFDGGFVTTFYSDDLSQEMVIPPGPNQMALLEEAEEIGKIYIGAPSGLIAKGTGVDQIGIDIGNYTPVDMAYGDGNLYVTAKEKTPNKPGQFFKLDGDLENIIYQRRIHDPGKVALSPDNKVAYVNQNSEVNPSVEFVRTDTGALTGVRIQGGFSFVDNARGKKYVYGIRGNEAFRDYAGDTISVSVITESGERIRDMEFVEPEYGYTVDSKNDSGSIVVTPFGSPQPLKVRDKGEYDRYKLLERDYDYSSKDSVQITVGRELQMGNTN
jgi:hypothetical protein